MLLTHSDRLTATDGQSDRRTKRPTKTAHPQRPPPRNKERRTNNATEKATDRHRDSNQPTATDPQRPTHIESHLQRSILSSKVAIIKRCPSDLIYHSQRKLGFYLSIIDLWGGVADMPVQRSRLPSAATYFNPCAGPLLALEVTVRSECPEPS